MTKKGIGFNNKVMSKTAFSIRDLWMGAKTILLDADGATSQLHILGVPDDKLPQLVELFLEGVAEIEYVTFSSTDHGATWPEYDGEAEQKFLSDRVGNWVFGGALKNDRSLRFFVDCEGETQARAELVFWDTEFFPKPNDQEKCISSFADLIAIADAFRQLLPDCEFAFDAYENGDPRERRNDTSTFFLV